MASAHTRLSPDTFLLLSAAGPGASGFSSCDLLKHSVTFEIRVYRIDPAAKLFLHLSGTNLQCAGQRLHHALRRCSFNAPHLQEQHDLSECGPFIRILSSPERANPGSFHFEFLQPPMKRLPHCRYRCLEGFFARPTNRKEPGTILERRDVPRGATLRSPRFPVGTGRFTIRHRFVPRRPARTSDRPQRGCHSFPCTAPIGESRHQCISAPVLQSVHADRASHTR